MTTRIPEIISRLRRTPAPGIAVFARAPVAGHAKTRLVPLLGLQGAARFQGALIRDALRKAVGLKAKCYLFLTANPFAFGRGRPEPVLDEQSAARARHVEFNRIRQQGNNLGERLQNGFRTLLRNHPRAVVIGTDSPLFPARILRQALRELDVCESVLGPCPDGGYYLIALRRPVDFGILRSIFCKVRWSTRHAFSDTLQNLLRLRLSCSVLEGCADVDLPADFRALKKEFLQNAKVRRVAPATWDFLKML